jgi:hypothetical protein
VRYQKSGLPPPAMPRFCISDAPNRYLTITFESAQPRKIAAASRCRFLLLCNPAGVLGEVRRRSHDSRSPSNTLIRLWGVPKVFLGQTFLDKAGVRRTIGAIWYRHVQDTDVPLDLATICEESHRCYSCQRYERSVLHRLGTPRDVKTLARELPQSLLRRRDVQLGSGP